MALPTNVNYGTVVGQFLLAYADSSDVDPQPDGIPAKGFIYFRPSPIKLLDATSSPNPVTILPAVVECALDAEGYLLGGDGTRGVRLVATTDTDLNPVNWTWTVEFRLTDQDDVPVPLPSFSIALPSSTTVDLTTVSPVPDANGTYYLVGPTGPQGPQGIQGIQGEAATITVGTVTTGAEGSSASVVNSGTSGDAVLDFTIPRGDTGAQGPIGPQGETGPIGPTGATGIEWQGAWNSSTDYVNNDAVFYNGASWFAAGDPPVGDTPSESSLYWFPLALQGATGATGPQGPQGEVGPQGEQGIQGEIGFPGFKFDTRRTLTNQYVPGEIVEYLGDYFICLANNDAIPPTGGAIGVYWAPYSFVGPQGDAATIAVGTVTTGAPGSSVIVTNSGTSGAAVFDFTIPKGDTGDIGNITAISPVTYNSATAEIGFDPDGIAYIDGGTA
jgi:hypothetical protein